MGALAASVYFLTCCRPALNPPFCYYIETPKFINFDVYQINYLEKTSSKCNHHEKLNDHSLNTHNSCTDHRAWSLDHGQQRRYFYDIISRHIPQCGEENQLDIENENEVREDVQLKQPVKSKPLKTKESENENTKKSEKHGLQKRDQEELPLGSLLSEKGSAETNIPPLKSPDSPLQIREIGLKHVEELPFEDNKIEVEDPDKLNSPSEIDLPILETSKLSDDLVEQLDCNLSNLETTFDKFVYKNRDFIQNLVECLNFEKKRQEELKNNHCKIKHENDILRTNNEYLKMVNGKQVENFKNELDKALSENKAGHLKQVQHLERVISCKEEDLQFYKQNELKLLKTIENNKIELHTLKNDISNLKNKETQLIKQYIQVLNFLDDVQKTLNEGEINGCHLQRSSNTLSSSEVVSELDEVLRNALYNGIECLNVRDLSILHDSIEELHERLCHQNEYCGRNPAIGLNVSDQQCYGDCDDYPSTDYIHKDIQDYESSLSMVPSRQGPERSRVEFCPSQF